MHRPPGRVVLFEYDLGGGVDGQILTVYFDRPGGYSLTDGEAADIFGCNDVLPATVTAKRVYGGSVISTVQPVYRNPVVVVVASRPGDKADVIGRGLTFIAPLFQKIIQTIA